MPLYEYYCDDCQVRFELIRPLSQSNGPASCPHCSGTHAHKMISVFAAVSKDANGGSRMVASSAPSGGCAGCGGGSCASCGH